MTVFIALLRGINVGGHKQVRMGDLVELCRSLGFGAVRTHLQSGNVIFESLDENPAHLSLLIEEIIFEKLGFPVQVILRSSGELLRIVVDNPLVREGMSVDRLHVTFLSDLPPEAVRESMSGEAGPDRYVIVGREVYLFCPDGYGRTTFTTTFFEKTLGIAATTRNWKTVIALADMAGE
ncbi:DUF1697 domain-containing protein [Methanosphaerula palustris]|uniref:DUF1697 domain-containing protein n=1 Tax=Methanosphaerula palustris (strain ATCC BAA-1556 / DSM 19958 / E1-9c) TaxID=521011 RepID=B8GEP5_METPE|nr:DUF1697 domain-containing protein [Methanosphaerula palustris]ACL17746.1 protein of unknown function DUF1697 [Methanosphaerula palustris E1-9c]